jgi:GST-like protein
MIQLYYFPTPNGHKISLFLEEAEIPYKINVIDITKNEQFEPSFLKISPNNRIPAIVDEDNGVSVFESGAILMYLAEKTGKFLSKDPIQRIKTLEWLFWQVGGLGPMAGQNHHFNHFAPEKVPYAIERYTKETTRLYSVLNKTLSENEFLGGSYSIADMACYPWIVPYEKQKQNINDFPNLKRWFESIGSRPATKRAYAIQI